jgi:hypothetical protein
VPPSAAFCYARTLLSSAFRTGREKLSLQGGRPVMDPPPCFVPSLGPCIQFLVLSLRSERRCLRAYASCPFSSLGQSLPLFNDTGKHIQHHPCLRLLLDAQCARGPYLHHTTTYTLLSRFRTHFHSTDQAGRDDHDWNCVVPRAWQAFQEGLRRGLAVFAHRP